MTETTLTLTQLVTQTRKLTDSLKNSKLNAQQLLDMQKSLSRLNEAIGFLTLELGEARNRGVKSQ